MFLLGNSKHGFDAQKVGVVRVWLQSSHLRNRASCYVDTGQCTHHVSMIKSLLLALKKKECVREKSNRFDNSVNSRISEILFPVFTSRRAAAWSGNGLSSGESGEDN